MHVHAALKWLEEPSIPLTGLKSLKDPQILIINREEKRVKWCQTIMQVASLFVVLMDILRRNTMIFKNSR